MIKFKELLTEIENDIRLTPKDIYNFFYLWNVYVDSPDVFNTPFGEETLNHYLSLWKKKYIDIFTKLIIVQLYKYDTRGRVDPDYPRRADLTQKPLSALLALMKKTFRSDMTRRNERWILIANATNNLANSRSPSDIFLWINQLLTAVHNTRTPVMDKLPNYHSELYQALEKVTNAPNKKAFAQYVDKDIRDLEDQSSSFLGESNTVKISRADRENEEFMMGLKSGVQDKASGTKRDLTGFSSDFVRGYKTVPKEGWWGKFNDRFTQWLADLGHSYGKR